MNKKNKIFILIIVLVLVICLVACIVLTKQEPSPSKKQDDSGYLDSYLLGKYHLPEGYEDDDFDYTIYVTDYDKYKTLADNYDLPYNLTSSDFKNNDYVLLKINYDSCRENIVGVTNVEIANNNFIVTFGYEENCGVCAPEVALYLLPVEKGKNTKYKVETKYQSVKKAECASNVDYKPLIYLYPEEDTEVTVKLGYPDKLITTYPKYKNSWNVLAKPNGDLIDLNTSRSLYGLYWEGLNSSATGIQEEGFIVKNEDTIAFLEEKLAQLGLTEREANEFIIYWLPKLEENNYNYIRFETKEEIDNNMPLEINPKPDTIIRVVMEYKGLDREITVREQQLETPIRKGFTVVEWGGTELK